MRKSAFRPAVLLSAASILALAACDASTLFQRPAPAPLAGATPAVEVAPDALHAQLIEDLRILSADDMQGRDTGSEGGARARDYIVGRLEALGVAPAPMGRLQPWEMQGRSREGPKTWSGTNIIGLIPGRRATDKYIVVTAHYDHVGVHDGHIYNGADDNASGVAAALMLAARLKAQAPDHSVLLVFTDGEERGLLGAKHFVEAPPVPLHAIVLNLNLDMLARVEGDSRLWVTGTYQHPYLRPVLEAVTAPGAVTFAYGKDRPEDTGADNWVNASDHAPFHAAGLPFLYFGADYHPDYHRPSDDFERVQPQMFRDSADLAVAGFRAVDGWLSR